jgi:predicted dehydrogenase
VVTTDPARQARVREAYPQARIFDRAEDLWAAAGDHDLAVVATPTGTHQAVALAAIEAGLAAVIDKPLGNSLAEGRRIAAAARDRGTWLSVFHNRRWDGETLTAARLLADGTLGAAMRLESRFERWRPRGDPAAWREGTPAEAGGGLLLDLGSHLVDRAMLLFGRPLQVYAEMDTRRPGNAAEDDVFIALEHAGGVRSHLWANAVAAHLGPSMRLLGRDGAYVKQGLDIQEEALRAGGVPGTPGWGVEPPDLWGQLVAGGEARAVETVPGNWAAYYVGVVESLTTGTPPPVTVEDGVAVLEVLDAARESARRRQVVPIPSASSASSAPVAG